MSNIDKKDKLTLEIEQLTNSELTPKAILDFSESVLKIVLADIRTHKNAVRNTKSYRNKIIKNVDYQVAKDGVLDLKQISNEIFSLLGTQGLTNVDDKDVDVIVEVILKEVLRKTKIAYL